MSLNRRAFILTAGGIATAGTFSSTVGSVVSSQPDVRSIQLLALHTNEYLHAPLMASGRFLQPGLAAVSHLLRDHCTNEVQSIDPKLLVYLCDLADKIGFDGAFHVISGYRSASTNALLRTKSSQVAKKSFHMFGRAVDIRVPGFASVDVQQAAIDLKAGGVGYYYRSDFVHLDTGKFRYW